MDSEGSARGNCVVCGGKRAAAADVCSTGCALEAWIPKGQGALPFSPQLLATCLMGFLLFNELMIGGACFAKARLGELESAHRFCIAATAIGSLWTILALAGWTRLQGKSVFDAVVALAFLTAMLYAILGLGFGFDEGGYALHFASNSLIAIWLSRRLIVSSLSKNEEKS